MLNYQHFLTSTHAASTRLNETPATALPDEITLQAVWYSGQFGKRFTTTDGRSVTIRQLGFWNRAAGPDFLHASIELDGQVHTGPLEIDTHSDDWENHGHDTNPAFNEVILHVVFRTGKDTHFTRSENHHEIPKVILPPELIESTLRSPRYASATAHPGRCSAVFKNLNKAQIISLLEGAARYRCELKARRIEMLEAVHGRDQALWLSLAETLGYKPNKLAMTLLAQRLPIHYLSQQVGCRSSLLFGVSGFLSPELHTQAPPESRQWIEQLWHGWWRMRNTHELDHCRKLPWQLSGVRPVNHPHRRVAALAIIASHWPSFRKFSKQPKQLAEWLHQLHDQHWSHHYTLRSKRSNQNLALIGKDRISQLIVNHLIPRQLRRQNPSIWNYYQSLPASSPSEAVKRAIMRLFGQREDQPELSRYAWQQQALLQIYQDFCLRDNSDCANCPMPEQLDNQ